MSISKREKITVAVLVAAALGVGAVAAVGGGGASNTPRALLGSITPQQPGGGGGGGGDITAVNVASPIAGGGATGAVTVSMDETGCIAGESWQFVSAGVWSCLPSGDITAVNTNSPIVGGATSGAVTLDFSTTGCGTTEGWVWTGAAWSCDPIGDITGVTAGTGLTGGATSANATLNVDPTVVQSRVSGTCAGAGNNIKGVNQDGTVSCDTTGGDLTAVTAGSGISVTSGTGPVPTIAIDTAVTQARVTGTCTGAGNNIRVINSDGTVTCDTTGGDLTAVTSSDPIVTSGGTGPTPALSLKTSGCPIGSTWRFDGTGWTCQGLASPNFQWFCYDEFFGATTQFSCGAPVVATSGTINYTGTTPDVMHPGDIVFTTILTIGSRAAFVANSGADAIVFGTGANNYAEAQLLVPNLSDGTDPYVIRVGFIDTLNADSVDGAYLEYDSTADASWRCKTASNSTRTTTDSTIDVTAAAWWKLRVEVDAASAVRFYINGTERCVGHSTANIPTGTTRATSMGVMFHRAAGGANTRLMHLDYVASGGSFTTTR